MKKSSIRYEYVIISVLLLISIIEITPYFITVAFPNICYGCTNIGKIHQYLDSQYNIGYISIFAYTFLFLYLIFLFSKFKNPYVRYASILFCIFMLYFPTVPILSVINLILYFTSKNPPFIHNYQNAFPASIQLEDNSKTVIEEFLKYTKNNKPDCLRSTNPGFKIEVNSTKDNCWRAIHLKKAGVIDELQVQYFPKTIELIRDEQIHNAIFSILDPGVEIPPHVGYYKGYLRYHMGIVIPNNSTNKTDDKAYIICGGKKYIWKEGEGVLFDDMYLHHVKNPTNHTRVVLYLDVKRKSDSYIVNKINDIGIYLLENAFLLKIYLKNQHSQIKIENYQ